MLASCLGHFFNFSYCMQLIIYWYDYGFMYRKSVKYFRVFLLYSSPLIHGFNSDDPALLLQCSPLNRPFYPCLPPVSSLFTPGLYSWLFVYCFCFFQSPVLPSLFLCSPSPSAPSITHSLLLTSPSLCYLLSVCPCSVSPLAHLSLSPFCLLPPCPMSTHTSNTSLFFFLCVSLISILLSLFCILVMLHEIHTWTQGPGQDLTDVLFSPHAADRHCSKKILWQESSKKNWILLSWHFILWVFAYSSDKTE